MTPYNLVAPRKMGNVPIKNGSSVKRERSPFRQSIYPCVVQTVAKTKPSWNETVPGRVVKREHFAPYSLLCLLAHSNPEIR